ncbi:MAG: hypothetical protein QOI74_281 [Micromonosporaceae bacterium]|nr:hypothetical protein [Micromonosporaceae bacterium]
MTVRVVLDNSALTAYARLEGIAVGELIAMVAEDGGAGVVGVPAAGFLASYAELATDERDRLVRMATGIDAVTVILPLAGTDTVGVATMEGRLPRPGSAHAIIEARTRGALLATYAGDTARAELPDEAVLDLE